MMSDKFYYDWPMLPWQRNFRQNWQYLGLCNRYLWDPCVCQGVLGVKLSNDVC